MPDTETKPKPQPFLRSVLSGRDGAGSTSRLCVLLLVVASIVWVSYLVARKASLPEFEGLTLFDTSMILALYGVNKLSGVASAKTERESPATA